MNTIKLNDGTERTVPQEIHRLRHAGMGEAADRLEATVSKKVISIANVTRAEKKPAK